MKPEERAKNAGTYIIVDGWQNYVPVLSALGSGHQEFKLTYDDGRLIESVELPASSTKPVETAGFGYLSMRETAKVLHQSYFWFSRHWRSLGLKPRRVGKCYFFALDNIRAMIARQRTPALKTGRRRRVIGDL